MVSPKIPKASSEINKTIDKVDELGLQVFESREIAWRLWDALQVDCSMSAMHRCEMD